MHDASLIASLLVYKVCVDNLSRTCTWNPRYAHALIICIYQPECSPPKKKGSNKNNSGTIRK